MLGVLNLKWLLSLLVLCIRIAGRKCAIGETALTETCIACRLGAEFVIVELQRHSCVGVLRSLLCDTIEHCHGHFEGVGCVDDMG